MHIDLLLMTIILVVLFLNRKVNRTMATVTDLQTSFESIRVSVSAIATKLAELQDQVNNGGLVTQAQLDALVTDAQAIDTSLKSLV